MSRGPGRIQQTIIALIESDEDGAWSTSDICAEAFRGVNRIEKKHRVAVSRALRTMALPEMWTIAYAERRGGDAVLFNRLSIDSTNRKRWLTLFGSNHCSFAKYVERYSHQVEKAQEEVDEYRRYYEADAVGRIDIEIAQVQKIASITKMFGGGSREYFESLAARIGELSARKAALQTAVNVSASQMCQPTNTYERASA